MSYDYDITLIPNSGKVAVSNLGFESGTSGWSTSVPAYHLNAGASVTKATRAGNPEGAFVGEVVTPGGAAAEGIAISLGSGFAAGPGSKYAVTLWVYETTNASLDIVLGKASADHAKLKVVPGAGSWRKVTVEWTPTTGAAATYVVVRTAQDEAAQACTFDVDAVEVAAVVSQELNDHDPFFVPQGGLTLPPVSYDNEFADSIYGEGARRTRSKPQNAEGEIALRVRAGLGFIDMGGDTGLLTYATRLEQAVEACRVHGGVLRWVDALSYDLEAIEFTAFGLDEIQFNRVTFQLKFTCRPYVRADPVTLVSNATSSDPIQSISLSGITGSAPALVQATVTDTATQARDHLEVGLDADWDGSAALLIDSASLSTSGLAGSATTRAGAYSSSGVVRATLGPDAMAVAEATGLTHKGRHRVKLRGYGTGTGPIYVRIAQRTGNGSWSRNSWARVPAVDGWYELDCGIVSASGAGSLSLRVEARTSLTTWVDTFDVDYLLMVPAYRYAKARGSVDTVATSLGARDQFNQSSGDLNSKSADVGGSWTCSITGANGMAVESTGHTAQRTYKSDTLGAGCMARVGSVLSGCSVQATVSMSAVSPTPTYPATTATFGVMARYSSGTSWVALVLQDAWQETSAPYWYGPPFAQYGWQLAVVTHNETLAATAISPYFAVTATPISLRLDVDAAGNFIGTWQGVQMLTGNDPTLATGGARDDGTCGLYDAYNSATNCTRKYDSYFASGISASTSYQHVVDASGAVILDDDSIARSDGTRPPSFEGSYLTVPPAGRENRVHRLAVKLRRTDVDSGQDSNIADSQRVDVTVTPRYILL